MHTRFSLFLLCIFIYTSSNIVLAQNKQIDSLKTVLKQTKLDTVLYQTNLKLGIAMEGKSLDSALFYYQNAVEIARKENWKKKHAIALVNIGFAYKYCSNSHKAMDYLQQARHLFEQEKDSTGLVNCLYNLGFFYGSFEQHTQAIASYNDALRYKQSSTSETLLSYIHNNIGLFYHYVGLYDLANKHQLQALKIKQKNKDKTLESTYINIALNYEEQQRFTESIKYNLLAIAILQGKETQTQLGVAYVNLGNVYVKIQKFDSAMHCYKTALPIFIAVKDHSFEARTYLYKGRAFYQQKQYKKAQEAYETALHKQPKIKNLHLLSSVYRSYATLSLDKEVGNQYYSLRNAIRMASLAEGYSEQRKLLPEQKECYQILYNAYAQKNNHTKALFFAKKLLRAKDSLFSVEKQRAVVAMQIRFETEKKIEQIASQTQELKNKQLILEKEIMLRKISITTLVFLVLFLIIIYRLYAQKRKTNYALAQRNVLIQTQKEELKTQNEQLHQLSLFKEDMSRMVVHDLKAPLNTIVNARKLPSHNSLFTVEQAGFQMLRLVQNILDVYKYKNTQLTPIYETKPLLSTIKLAVQELQHIILQKQLSLDLSQSLHITLRADHELLQRVFANLFANACQHSPVGTPIKVSLQVDQEKLLFSIINQGSIIPKNLQDKIFERFVSNKKNEHTHLRSSGLGLTFCKLAIVAHTGTIGVHSEKESKTEFWFTLPKKLYIEKSDAEIIVPKSENESFTTEDIEYLTPFQQKLLSLHPVDASEIIQVLTRITSTEKNIINWIERIENAVYSGDEEQYFQLLLF